MENFEEWKEKVEKINEITAELNRLPSLGAWNYLYNIAEHHQKKDEQQTKMAEHTIAQLRHLVSEYEQKTAEVKAKFWTKPEVLQHFREVDAEGGVTLKLPGMWQDVLKLHKKELKELTNLYARAFGEDK